MKINGKIEVYTDGACRGNGADHNVGGWAYVIYYKNGGSLVKTKYYEAVSDTTNNKMELTAILKALLDLQEHDLLDNQIVIYSDSAYAINSVTVWCQSWKLRGWRKTNNEPILNLDIIKSIDKILQEHSMISFVKVKGHSGDSRNDEVDFYCNQAMDELLQKLANV